jgi:dienelactone hydrolase
MRAVARRRFVLVMSLIAAIAAGDLVVLPFMHGLSFVIRAADMKGTVRRLADLDADPEREREVTIPTVGGGIRARIYEPAVRAPRRTALLVSGLHPSGIDEPRLVRLARDLASDDLRIVTPDIPELSRFEITPAITDAIEQAASWLATQPGFAPDGRIGMMGISFSGGLSIVAAGRPSLKDRVAYVFSFGGHDDLTRVLRYLCTGQEALPRGQVRLKADTTEVGSGRLQPDVLNKTPHDYGVAVILLGVADRVVPAAQVERLREGVRRYLWASALDSGVDQSKAEAEFDAVRALARTLPQPAATLLREVVDRDVVHLGARLLPYVSLYGGAPALSVAKSPKPSSPVFLLHGTEDNVIPSVESEYLAEDLRGHAPVRLLLSGLISHADADRPPHAGDVAALASFWGDLLTR